MNDRSESTDSAIARGILTGEVKALIQARAYSFDPARLIDLLAYYGVPREDITFESNPDRASASTIDSIRFQDDGRVLVRVNMGLLGDTGTLPSYFQLVVERSGTIESFRDFVRFFDDRLISSLIRATYPERDPTLFGHWPSAVVNFRRLSVVGSGALLQSLLAKTFPELRVHVQRTSIFRSDAGASLVMGENLLDGGGLLGEGRMADPNGFAVTLVAFEPTASGGRRWPGLIARRFVERVEPVLAAQRLAFDMELVVVDHEERAGLQKAGFLGYERMGGASESVHRVRLYRGVVGHDAIQCT